jgi:putative hemolysin
MPLLEIAILLMLVVLNGLLAMSELAVVSARRSKLKALAEDDRPGARRALALASEPGRFLSTVQIGITLVGVLAGAVSGASLGVQLGDWLFAQDLGIGKAMAGAIGFGVVVTLITYLSLVIGELVPKQLALRNPERVALLVAPAMTLLSRLAAPFVWGLDASGRMVLRLFGGGKRGDADITDEEIKALMAEAEATGAIEPEERQMISGILRLGDRKARTVMTPRTDVEAIDAGAAPEEIERAIRASGHGRFPVYDGKPDEIIGVLQAKDALNALLAGKPLDVKALMRPAPVVPDTADVLSVMRMLRESRVHVGLVHDEYGQFEGIITNGDILGSITGAFHTDEGEPEPMVVERADGSWLMAGSMPADEVADHLSIKGKLGPAQTAAGLVIAALKHIPQTGESVVIAGWTFEVVDMDGRRIDKLLVSRAHRRKRH